jgi:hypothetical protein
MSGIALAIVGRTTASVPVIGSALGGGFFAGQVNIAGTIYNLIIGPNSSAYNGGKQWKTSNTDSPGTYSVVDGASNTAAMNNASHPAAQFCTGVTAGGFSDWYMPANNELEICYYNLKPTTQVNDTGGPVYGYNGNSVPPRSGPYTSGTPAQTSASAFIDGQAEQFFPTDYWASYQQTNQRGWYLKFQSGRQYYLNKTYSRAVRAARKVAF